MPKNLKKQAALKKYETTIRGACDVRRVSLTEAQATFERTKNEAHNTYIKNVENEG